ncbi:MAG: Rrf2 family transcriptional regulator [Methylacidiphilales bacterium]|nr:Rrf2 family transcriptional regulator [Candidatus Methylacidiphilales bacterium]MDW8349476.1 Rrf2 family transcriptional regulator [Verrucomicrobiae bacterium]
MKISKRTDYALRVLFTLAEFHQDAHPIPIGDLARRNDIPKRFLEQIMLDLKAHGWVKSIPGKKGGYLLALDPDQISMGEVVRAFDGMLAPIGCVSATNYEACSQERFCRFRRVFLDIRNYAAKIMERATLGRVLKQIPVAPEEILHGLHGEGI